MKKETIEIDLVPYSTDDRNKVKSGETCGFYYNERLQENFSKGVLEYKDITDKNTCFNAKQFDALKN